MGSKVPFRYRAILFALVMSSSTSLIVSGLVIYLHARPDTQFVLKWLSGFVTAWPIVFVAILVIAPLVNQLLDLFVEEG